MYEEEDEEGIRSSLVNVMRATTWAKQDRNMMQETQLTRRVPQDGRVP